MLTMLRIISTTNIEMKCMIKIETNKKNRNDNYNSNKRNSNNDD